MGCVSSSPSARGQAYKADAAQDRGEPLHVRRCLSLEVVDGPGDEPESDLPTTASSSFDLAEERSLLLTLNQQDVLDLIQQAGAQKFSIASETDQDLNRAASFSSKLTEIKHSAKNNEAALNLSRLNIGYACKKGLKPEAPNQDSFFICQVEDAFSIYGVFDGHGKKGHDISNFIKDCLPKLLVGRSDIMSSPMTVLKEVFLKTQRLIEQATNLHRLDATRSGSTASVILHDHKKRMLYTAHVGDSRCVLAKQAPDAAGGSLEAEWRAVDLTEDHKPNLPAEKARIEQCGGQVRFDGGFNYRVYAKGKRYPGLNMSRAMGDLLGFHDAGISAEPDVAQTLICSPRDDEQGSSPRSQAEVAGDDLPRQHSGFVPSLSSHSIDPMTDRFLLLCSDGVWEFMSSEEATLAIAGFKASDAMHAAEHLAEASWDRWMHHMDGEVVDDITVLLVHLDAKQPKP